MATLTMARFARALAVAAVLSIAVDAQAPQPPMVFRAGTELVLVNVVVRDKSGAIVRGLSPDAFTVTEDDKPQTITSFDFEEPDRAFAEAAPPAPTVLGTAARQPAAPAPAAPQAAASAAKVDMRGRRLIVLFFDLSSMEPEAVARAARAAHDYVDQKLSPADLVGVASFATSLRIDQDFTADQTLLDAAIDRFGGAASAGLDLGTTGDVEDTPDNGAAFVADDTEFNIFSTDRRLQALQSICEAVAGIDQKKSIVYFSSGMAQSGQDNQVELRRVVDRANRANVSFYAADMRGLQALVPGGDATQASRRGVSPFSGASVANQFTQLASTQDTVATLAEDTGGKAFFDSNSFGAVFDRVVSDTSAYYVLGYSSTNPTRDGRFRRIKVRLKDSSLKLEYRSGYYAPRDFAHSTRQDREQQLQDQLQSDLSATDLSAYATTAFFRVAGNRFFVPISIAMPGSQVPFTQTTDKNHATIDVLAGVRDDRGRAVGLIRDTLRIAPESTGDLRRKIVQYESGLELAPGTYRLKVVVRENQNGTMGSYETEILVPALARAGVKTSSIVVGTELKPSTRKNDRNPLVRDGRELVPNITHVVSTGQHLYFYYEVYDPARERSGPETPGPATAAGVKIVTSLTFFRDNVRAFETPPVEATALNGSDGRSTFFQFDVPAASLPPGLYTCQVNVVDDVAGTFAFPRLQIYVRRAS